MRTDARVRSCGAGFALGCVGRYRRCQFARDALRRVSRAAPGAASAPTRFGPGPLVQFEERRDRASHLYPSPARSRVNPGTQPFTRPLPRAGANTPNGSQNVNRHSNGCPARYIRADATVRPRLDETVNTCPQPHWKVRRSMLDAAGWLSRPAKRIGCLQPGQSVGRLGDSGASRLRMLVSTRNRQPGSGRVFTICRPLHVGDGNE